MNERQQLLAELRELYVPHVSSLPAVGWWLLVLLVILLFAVFRFFRKRARHPSWLTEAQREIQNMQEAIANGETENIVPQCSSLARRLSLLVDSDNTNASVIGKDWLARLDAIAERPLFTEGVGQLLESAPYKDQSELTGKQLVSLVDSINVLCTAVHRRQVAE